MKPNFLIHIILSLFLCITLTSCIKSEIPSGKIIFGKGEEILGINPDGRDQKIIIKLPPETGGLISPDGKKIIFNTFEQDKTSIYYKIKTANLSLWDIKERKQIKLTEGDIDMYPSFSSNGKRIIFSSTRDGEDYEIYVMNIDEPNNIIRLTDNSFDDTNPKFSPDGKKIVFDSSLYITIPYTYSTSDKNDPTNKKYDSCEICIMDVDGKKVIRLTNNSVNDSAPTWSPEGKRITFISDGELCIMDVDGKNLINLTKDNPNVIKITEGKTYSIVLPCWSPDGKYISFILIGGRKIETNIYIISIDGKNIRRVTEATYILAWLPTSP